MNNYWTREKREEWQRYFEEQEAFHGGVKESKSAPMSIGEVRRALATVDALEKMLQFTTRAVEEEVESANDLSHPMIYRHFERAKRARALLAALEGKP